MLMNLPLKPRQDGAQVLDRLEPLLHSCGSRSGSPSHIVSRTEAADNSGTQQSGR